MSVWDAAIEGAIKKGEITQDSGVGLPKTEQAEKPSIWAPAIEEFIRKDRDEKSRAFTTLFGASKDNPDRAAKAKQLAERTGLGLDTVLSDLDTIQQRLALDQTQQQVADSPALTRAMQDPTFAKLTHDDVPQLTQLEQWWRQSAPKAVTKSVPTDRQYKRLFDHLRQQNPYMDVEQVRATAQKEVDSGRWAQTYLKLPRASRTWGEAIDDTVLGFGESANSLGGSVIELARQNPMAVVNYIPAVRQWYDDTQAALRRGEQYYKDRQSDAVKDFDAQLAAAAHWWQMPGMILSDPGMTLQQLSRSSAYLLPGMAAGRFGALPALGVNAVGEGLDAGKTTRAQVIQDGGTPEQQDKAATLAFVTATAISLGVNKALGTHKIEADFWKTGRPGAAVTKLLTREVPQEIVEEGGNQFGQNVGLIHTTQPNRALFEGVAKAAALGGTLGLAQGGLMSGTGKVLDSVLGRIAPDVEQVAQTRTTAEVLQKLHETVLTSKTLPRDAATFGQYLQTLQETHGEVLPAVYVSPTALQNALLQSGLDVNTTLAAMPETARQIDDALLTGAEVRIPLTEYATQLAPVFDRLLPEVRTQPDGLNQRDADALLQDLPDLVRAATVRQMDVAAVSEQWRQEVATIEQQVLAGLDATGKFHRTERQKMAGLLSGAYGVLAHRSGVTPAQFAAAHPLPQIVAERFMQQRGLAQLPGREAFLWEGVAQDETRIAFVAKDFSLVSAQAIPFEDGDFADGGMAELGLMGHAAHVTPGATPYVFDVRQGAGKIGDLVADVLDGKIVAVHNIKVYSKKAGLGSRIMAALAANADEPLRIIEMTDSAKLFWDKVGVDGYDLYKNGSLSWESVAKYLAGKPRADNRDSDGEPNIPGTREEDIRVAELSPEEIAELERQGIKFEQRAGESVPRGAFDPDSNTLALYEKANLSTFLHESGHFFLELLADLASQPNAPTAIASDFNAIQEWFALPESKTWAEMTLEEKRPYHEQFARGFEAYWFEGKAPAPRLEKAFSAFRAWLVRIYKQLTALNVELTDEVRGVFDRLLATEQEIAEVTARRALEPLFASKPDSMTPEDWAAYQALPADATEDAVRQVEQRALRDMRWLSNAKSRALKELQKEANGKRAAVREDVKKQMAELPIYRAREWLQKGSMRAEDGTEIQANAGYKFNIADLEALYPGGALTTAPNWRQLGYGKYGMLAKEGLPPDLVAEMFGYPSGDYLVRQLLEWPHPTEYLRAETDRLMLERHGDLVDDAALERAAEEAIVNDARVKMVATELAAVKAVYGNANEINAASKQYAVDAVGRMRVGELRPQQHLQASTRAGKDAERALAKGNTELVAQKKREQVLQLWLYKEALAAQREETGRRAFFAKVLKDTNEQLVAKNRDPDVVHTARLVLAEFGLGTERQVNRSREYVERVREYDPGMASQMSASLDAAAEMGKPYPTLSIAEARSVQTEVEALWEQARRSRQMEVDGKLLDRVEIAGELVATLDARGLPERAPGEGQAVTRVEALKMQFLSAGAALRRVEAWTRAVDKTKTDIGAFRRYIFLPVKDAADNYRAAKAQRLQQLKDALAPIEQDFTGELIAAPELGHTFGKGSVGGMAELFHALLHTGNDSNKSKLLRGMRNQDKQAWAAQLADGTLDTRQWDAFIARMVQEGRLRKEHFDALQAVWDLLEEMKPALQEAHRQATGRYFDEIPAQPFDTPWGSYRGGYVPVVHDTQAVTDASIRALIADEHNALAFTFTGAASGMTKSRAEGYAVPLLLDVRSLAQHIDKVLIYSYMEVPVRDVRRTLNDISGPLSRYDRAALEGMLTPWLQRAVTQQVETPAAGLSGVMSVFRTLRSRAGMAAMFANVSNTVQQITGFSLAAVRVPPKYLLHATVLAVTRGPELMRGVADSSIYMKHRMQNESATMDAAIDGLLLNPNPLQKAERWTREHAYFMQAAFDNVMSPIIWTAKYSQALEQGLSELDARREADSIVRETQGSTLAEDISRMESGNAFVRLFTQFLGYFNMQYNLLLTEFGNAPGLGRKLYVTLLGFSIPAIVAQAIALAFKGGAEDEDKDGEYLDDWLYQTVVMGQFKTAAAFVPGVGALVTTAVNKGDAKPYNDRMSLSPAVSMVETASGVMAIAAKATDSTKDQRDSRVIKDIATALSLATGLPVSAAAKPLAYQADIGEGRIPEPNPLERTRGYITGSAPPR